MIAGDDKIGVRTITMHTLERDGGGMLLVVLLRAHATDTLENIANRRFIGRYTRDQNVQTTQILLLLLSPALK